MDRSERKRILLFTDGFPWSMGEYTFIYNELVSLARKYDVTIIANVKKDKLCQKIDINLPENVICKQHVIKDLGRSDVLKSILAVTVSQAWKNEKEHLKNLGIYNQHKKSALNYITIAYEFYSWLKENININDYDVFYTYWNSYATLALSMLKQNYTNLIIVTRTHGYDLYNERMPMGRQYFKKYVDMMVNKVIFIAESGLEYYIANFADSNIECGKYIFNPIGVIKASCIPEKEDKVFNIISCSSVIPLKRVELIADALSLIDDITINWTHIGGGLEYDSLFIHCNELKNSQNNITYTLLGNMSNFDVRKYYDSHYFDCFITTSSTEGSPVSIQEALAYGIPVIGTDVGEISNLIDGCGILLNQNPTKEVVADAIRRILLMDEHTIKTYRYNAYSKWQNQFDASKNSDEFVKIIDRIIL